MSDLAPLVLPAVGFDAQSTLELSLSVSQSRSGGRLTNVIEFADPVWIATMKTLPLYNADYRRVQTWFNSMRGGIRPVIFRLPRYVPAAHAGNLEPAKQAGTVSAVTSANVVSVIGVHAALILTQGDFVSFLTPAGRRYLVQVDKVNGSGTSRTITFEPPLSIGANIDAATVYFDRAEILMRPIWNSFKPETPGYVCPASFQLVESRL
ncbi:hypothetical protein [Mangrovicella endophytica]|uniref:hypothetical protein n=1 Tax=Mangrovicella endophytica TaxID=2066697 RepID=UPI000C9EAE90|nr:hypothetical protein [Mangrovicella endophytica]